MFADNGMKSVDGIPMRPRNSNLNEDLGKVEHVFSDKTGTLTQNIMTLQKWMVNGRIIDEDGSKMMVEFANGNKTDNQDEKDLFRLFLNAVALCHTVVPSYDEDKKLTYEGDSPDEAALLDALRQNDVLFTKRTPKGLTVEFFGKEENFELLRTIEFNSARKRMSVIVRSPEGKIYLFCKGADNIIMDRRSKDISSDELEYLTTSINEFSRNGLRTLLIGYIPMEEKDYEAFQAKMREAETAMDNREDKVQEVTDRIEQNLLILGATAVEDKLQIDVDKTIDYLIKCGIHVWMLTGDKLETAISIGKSTKILTEDMNLMIIDTEESRQTKDKFDYYLQEVREGRESKDATEMKSKQNNAMVVTGKALAFALEECADKFLELSQYTKSVICCRVSPLQKAMVVKLVRTKKKRVCLSIGDGANDVSMIQVANIGVGIIGLEGNQAVRASDFAFKEFRALKRLISVHGRYSYIRMSKLILFSFWKNLVMIFPQFWSGFYTGWSGVPLYHEFFLTCFNLVFTSLPPFFLAIFEKDVQPETINRYPEVYKTIKNDQSFNWKRDVEWGMSAFIQGIILYFTMNLSYNEGHITEDGIEYGYFLTVADMGFIVLTTILVKWAFVINHWHYMNSLAGILSYIVFVGLMFVFASESYVLYADNDNDLGLVAPLLASPYFYLEIVLAVVTALVPDLTFYYIKRNYFPEDFEILEEEETLRPIHSDTMEAGLNQPNETAY